MKISIEAEIEIVTDIRTVTEREIAQIRNSTWAYRWAKACRGRIQPSCQGRSSISLRIPSTSRHRSVIGSELGVNEPRLPSDAPAHAYCARLEVVT
ncbi:hypothetical protein EVAR_6960_1 [Eumeta japonica]|uniref:Uncharacterized protein n=1 Tax=Eumeta variegata TaxID=151549 RepID=A0A4C1TGL2_EUMVA|nr:hypothetical protein EVAR_6960_1 [Eumeta japonica]